MVTRSCLRGRCPVKQPLQHLNAFGVLAGLWGQVSAHVTSGCQLQVSGNPGLAGASLGAEGVTCMLACALSPRRGPMRATSLTLGLETLVVGPGAVDAP